MSNAASRGSNRYPRCGGHTRCSVSSGLRVTKGFSRRHHACQSSEPTWSMLSRRPDRRQASATGGPDTRAPYADCAVRTGRVVSRPQRGGSGGGEGSVPCGGSVTCGAHHILSWRVTRNILREEIRRIFWTEPQRSAELRRRQLHASAFNHASVIEHGVCTCMWT